ncbi:MAG: hypothetical protein GYA51_10165 [Candidatus Methanofastidiosa archaeon]|nr:hypothetical protein [Candidatus Methanofastidiosa archaeon]
MIVYKKENGFPMSITVETKEHEDKENEWKGYESTILDENGGIIDKIYHSQYRERVSWVNGFFKGLTYKTTKKHQ